MRRKSLALIAGPLVLTALAGCGSSSSNKAAIVEEDAYAGSQACKVCHSAIYDNFVNTGHPYKLNKVENGQVPVFPHSDINGALELVQADGSADNALGIPASYGEATYVIGGFGWKARWIDADGYIVTGTNVQYNLADGSLADYDAGKYGAANGKDDKSYTCGNCHTTGWRPYDADLNPDRQDDLPGIAGTFVAGGVHCESCHGAGAKHAKSKSKDDIVRVATARTTEQLSAADQGYGLAITCGECHTRDGEKNSRSTTPYVSPFEQASGLSNTTGGRIVSNGTVGKHHQTYDELLGVDPDTNEIVGKKVAAGMTCVSCHDPHKTVKYQAVTGVPAITAECADCHDYNGDYPVAMPAGSGMADLDCKECHMPLLAKSAIWTGTNKAGAKLGDIKSHIFKIDLSKAEQLTEDKAFVYPWITADYACGSCHDFSGIDLSGYKFHRDTVGLEGADTFKNVYAGSANCGLCHEEKYADFSNSGHPYKLNKVENGQVPTFPHSDIEGALELVQENGSADNALGIPASYDEATYVIGGFGWKARWIDADGYIVTGTNVQYNLADGSLADYDAGKYGAANGKDDKSYTCGNCHTTGWRPYDADLNPNRQDDLPGMAGTFAAGGVHCESCHGAGLRHVFTRNKADITRMAAGRTQAELAADDQGYGLAVTCGECHTRDGERKPALGYATPFEDETGLFQAEGGRIVSNGTTGKHHQTYDELLGIDPDTNQVVGKKLQSVMFANGCATCHDPHKSTKYEAAGAIKIACTDCHSVGFTVGIHGSYADCLDCHMPGLAKSAIWAGSETGGTNKAGVKVGDIKSHIFKIDLTKTEQLTADSLFVYPWITPDYACGECHADPAAKVNNLGNYGGKIHQ